MDLWVLWLIIVIVLAVIEVMTVNLVSVWFIASGLISLFLSFFIDSFFWQFAIFVILGLIFMIITRPLLVKKFGKSDVKTNLDRVIGMKGIVTSDISKLKVGEVKVDGKTWSAIADKKIEIGTTVIVEAIDGVKLVVRKDEE